MTTPSDDLPPEIAEALEKGNVIEAIKKLRESRNVSLAEAKQIMEALRARRWGKLPAERSAPHLLRSEPATHTRRSGLSPGEMPRRRTGSALAMIFAAVAVAVVAAIAFKLL